ncbi:hypothetical protein CAPTEDRAFT_194290 [Capitella teleta]|uniref:Endonuclease/exonuclease/phosphatase domain-containing protein n=1 Tax=Capitella teleta TaxID=283909 RepID=R7TD39_CAPTE|nr:hypothetical protein CAPTEDRAFT_194290 [Capitella teleta]|eukprot:ELT89402.1 hypothetical protein CAPTEDRAFT_194290 [Capitella teleta]
MGRKVNDCDRERLLKVPSANSFDVRSFLARYDERRKTGADNDAFVKLRMQSGRSKEEQCYRKDRAETQPNVRGGRYLFGIDNRLPSILYGIDNRLPSIRRHDLECSCEVLIALILVYGPSSSNIVSFINMLNETNEFSYVCLIGDFNRPNIHWNTPDTSPANSTDVEFIRMTQSHALDQLNTYPSNANGSFLDLVFANGSALVCNITHLDGAITACASSLKISESLTVCIYDYMMILRIYVPKPITNPCTSEVYIAVTD